MKKFSRCMLILILVTVLGTVGGYFYADKAITPVYSSETVLYVVVDESSEASLRSKDGGLNDDFEMLIKGSEIISEAQRSAGTSESIDKYLQVVTPANSNIIKIICNNPDAQTAKTYVDAVARAAVNSIGGTIPVKSVKIMSPGTVSSRSYKPELYIYMAAIAGIAAAACLIIEILVLLFMSAFAKKEDNSDDESEYERRYGNVVYLPAGENFSKSTRRNDDLSNDDDIEIEGDDVKVKPSASAVKNAGSNKSVLAEETQISVDDLEDEEPVVVGKQTEAVKQEIEKEPVYAEKIIEKSEASMAAPQNVYGTAEEVDMSPYGTAEETANTSPYGVVEETANMSLYEDAKETVYGASETEKLTEPERSVEPEPVYGSIKEMSKESVYGSMPQETFVRDENETAVEKEEPVNKSVGNGAEQTEIESVDNIKSDGLEELPVMDAVLQAQQSASSKYVYKDEEENASSTANVSSKYLYKGEESYKKPVSEPAESKLNNSEYSEDAGMNDIIEVPEKAKKKSRIIGIIRK